MKSEKYLPKDAKVVSSEYTLARVFTYMDAPSCLYTPSCLYRRTEVGTATRVAAGRLCTYIQCTQAGGGGVPLALLLCTELLLDAA